MPLTAITVTYGASGLSNPATGQPASGVVVLQLSQETPSATYTMVPTEAAYNLVNGQIDPAHNEWWTNGQPMQVAVFERIAGAGTIPPYVVSVPASGTLDLSIANRVQANTPPLPL